MARLTLRLRRGFGSSSTSIHSKLDVLPCSLCSSDLRAWSLRVFAGLSWVGLEMGCLGGTSDRSTLALLGCEVVPHMSAGATLGVSASAQGGESQKGCLTIAAGESTRVPRLLGEASGRKECQISDQATPEWKSWTRVHSAARDQSMQVGGPQSRRKIAEHAA